MTYLDHAATTPALPEVVEVVAATMSRLGNASALHSSGRDARRLVEESREAIAADLGARPSEVVFTSGGTESDNLGLTGIFRARRAADPARRRVLVPAVEHHAVLDTAEYLERTEGARISWLEVDDFGRVHADTLSAAIAENPADIAVISVMWANNEVGTVNPIRELASTAAGHGIPFHSDAVQAVGQLPVDFAASGASAMSMTGHKLGGPVGCGALLVRRESAVEPILHGGGQERGIRSGTLNVAGIAGLAVAVSDAVRHRSARISRWTGLQERLRSGLAARVEHLEFSGDPGGSNVDGGPSRLPANVHVRFAGCEGDSLLMLLDARGIECSTGSACTAGVARPSHVLLGMGVDEDAARGSLRFSFGHETTEADIDAVLGAIGPVVERARAAVEAGRRRAAAKAADRAGQVLR